MTYMDSKAGKRLFANLENSATDWHDHLTPQERERLQEIVATMRALSAEKRRIYDRARKRVSRS